MKAIQSKNAILASAAVFILSFGIAFNAIAIEFDTSAIKQEIAQAVAAGVDKETATINAVRDGAATIFQSRKAADPEFAMTEKQIATQILEQLGMPGNGEGNEDGLRGLVIDILPIEADVVAMMDTGVGEDTAVRTVAKQWAEKIYQEQLALNPSFDVPVPTIAQRIEEMLWELGVDDIEGYETPEAFESAFRQADALAPIDDEVPASQI